MTVKELLVRLADADPEAEVFMGSDCPRDGTQEQVTQVTFDYGRNAIDPPCVVLS